MRRRASRHVAAARVAYVHRHTGATSLIAPSASPKVEYLDRDYLRGSSGDTVRPDGTVAVGTTMGGGQIYTTPSEASPSEASAPVPTLLWVVDSEGRVWPYVLSGGP